MNNDDYVDFELKNFLKGQKDGDNIKWWYCKGRKYPLVDLRTYKYDSSGQEYPHFTNRGWIDGLEVGKVQLYYLDPADERNEAPDSDESSDDYC